MCQQLTKYFSFNRMGSSNLGVAALLGVFLVPAFYTRHTVLQQALSIGVGLAAAIGLRMVAHWWLRRLRE
jgi:hypothetical protein